MKCSKCGHEVLENAKYCPECGEKLVDEKNQEEGKKLNDSSKIKHSKKKFYIIGGVIVCLIIIIISSFYLLDNIKKFENLFLNERYEEAKSVYLEKIKGNLEKENHIKEMISSQANLIYDKYKSKDYDYDTAKNKLQSLKEFELINEQLLKIENEIDSLQQSRIAYEKAQQYLANKEYKEALNQLNKVISIDENYDSAQNQIKENLQLLKQDVIKRAEDLYNNGNIEKAIEVINQGLDILKDDVELVAKKEIYEEKRIEELKNNQEIVVLSTRIISDWLHGEMAEVVVKNTTKKTVKKYEVGYMAYDKNGYPIKTGWLTPAYLTIGEAEHNIQPGETYGRNMGWELDNDETKTILACVKRAEYYDGTVWDNPYYEYWVKEHLEKPLN